MRSSSREHPHKTPAERAQIVAAYQQTPLDSQQFARRHGIAASTLFRWLRQSAAPTNRGAAALIEVPNLLGPPSPAPAYRVRFANGLSVELRSGFEPEEVRVLAQILQRL